MEFSRTTRDELARIIPERRCCQLAELAGLVYVDGVEPASPDQKWRDVVLRQAAAARVVYLLFKKLYDPHIEVKVRQQARFHKHHVYVIRLPRQPHLKEMFRDLKGVQERYAQRRWGRTCCRKAFLRGVYLGRGSVTDPAKNYHLEIATDNLQQAEIIQNCINTFSLEARVIRRKRHAAVYLKDGEQIVELLSLMGAHTALLNLESVRVVKGMRNRVNRLVNCETANMDKVVSASMQQVENIELVRSRVGLSSLPPGLIEVARVRLNHPYASLKELGQMLKPPMSKSGVNHRLRKLGKIADSLRQGSIPPDLSP